MLKITIVDDPTEQRLILEGRLSEPEVAILSSAWDNVRGARGIRRCVVDLRNTTFIDESAERMLLDMKSEGAQFVACGISTTHRLEQLGIKCRETSQKTCC